MTEIAEKKNDEDTECCLYSGSCWDFHSLRNKWFAFLDTIAEPPSFCLEYSEEISLLGSMYVYKHTDHYWVQNHTHLPHHFKSYCMIQPCHLKCTGKSVHTKRVETTTGTFLEKVAWIIGLFI